jgi:lysylphosphatidylglycerol synthetase-like protein (DUF2156 family)
MNETRYSLLRDILALVIVAASCPLAVYGGSAAACIGAGGLEFECAINGVWIAPLMLLVAGGIAGLVTRGWTGLLIVLVGTVIGMFSILVISFLVGRPVPVDGFSGVVATIWFLTPIVIGYGVGRVIVRLLARRTAGPEG